MKKILVILSVILLVSAPVIAQEIDYCEGDFDCDGDCDGTDASVFKFDFGRSDFKNPCPSCIIDVAKTGQTTSYAPGDDGDLEKGFEWPNPRFTDNLDGTVTDNLTGLIWLKDANCFGTRTWYNALSDSNGLADGSCGLADSSQAGDWRLPNKRELLSLISDEYYGPAVPDTAGSGRWSQGNPFTNIQTGFTYYWSSNTWAGLTSMAWHVQTNAGTLDVSTKTLSAYYYVWPVRGGQ